MDLLARRLAELQQSLQPRSAVFHGHLWEWLETGGPGSPMLLLPGSAADAYMFVHPLAELSGRRMVSVSPPALSEPEQLADGLAALCEHLGLAPALLLGSSFGAWWGPFFAQRHPARVHAMLLGNGLVDAGDLASNPLFDRDALERTPADELHVQWRARIEAAPASPLRDLQLFMLGRKTPQALKAHLLAVARAVPCPAAALPPDRVVVLDCEDDPVIPAAGREHVRRHHARARHVTLATGGHYPHLLNWPAYREALLPLLDQ